MNEQHKSFETALLRDVISRVLGGGTPSRSVAAFWGGDIPWASVKDFADGKAVIYDAQEHITERGLASSATNIARSNSVVVCTRIAVGRAALCGRDIAINQDVKALYPNERLSPEYLLLLLKHYQPLLESKAIGSTVKGISTDELLDLQISFPRRFEQTQIAAVLSCIDRAIEHTEALIAKQQRIKTGLMQDLLTKGIDEHGNIRSEATHEFKDSPLGRIPKEWEVTSLNDVGKWFSGGTPSKAQPRFWNGTIPWISSKDMKRFHLNGSIDYVTEEGANSGTRIVPKDTILIVVRGMVLAHTFPVGITIQDTAFNQDLKACVCNPQVSPMYLAYMLLSNSSNLLRLTTEATHGTKRLDSEELFRFKIAIPKDKKEQNSIVNLVETFDVQIRTGKDQSDKLKVIKQGLMQDLLTGKVSVSGLLAESAAGIA